MIQSKQSIITKGSKQQKQPVLLSGTWLQPQTEVFVLLVLVPQIFLFSNKSMDRSAGNDEPVAAPI